MVTKKTPKNLEEVNAADEWKNKHQPATNNALKLKLDHLKTFDPLTDNQKMTFESYRTGQHLLLIGTAGTGKSFLSMFLGMKDIMENKNHKKIMIVRSVVPTRDMGFLPGNNKEKSKVQHYSCRRCVACASFSSRA